MQTKTILKSLLSVAIISSLTACGGGGSGEDSSPANPVVTPPIDTTTAIHSLDLSNAQGFFITGDTPTQTTSAKSNSTSKSATRTLTSTSTGTASTTKDATTSDTDSSELETNTAYKILKDGTIEAITVQDSNGDDNERGSLNIVHIDEITANYKIIYLHVEEPAFPDATPYLLHNQTGRLYSLADALGDRNIDAIFGRDDGFEAKYFNVSATEGKDGQLFLDDDDTVHIISKPSADAESITATEITDILGGWTITADSKFILYAANNDYDTESDDIFAVSTETQSRYDMNSLMGDQLNTGRVMLSDKVIHGFDGNTYLYDFNNTATCSAYQIITGSDGLPSIKAKVAFTNKSAVDFAGTTCINDLPLEQVIVDGDVYYQDSKFNLLSIDWDNKIFTNVTKYNLNSLAGGQYDIPAEFANEKTYKIGVADSLSTSGEYIYRSGEFAESSNSFQFIENNMVSMNYLASDDVVLERINVKTGDVQVFFSQDSDYVLKTIDAMADGTIYVTGSQLTTGESFVGTLNESGFVSVTSSSGSYALPEIVIMQPINTTDFLAVDGNPRDWNIDFRSLSDATNDQSSGNMDLTFYSEDTGNGFYYGLIEHTGEVADNTKIELTLSNGDTLVNANDTFIHYDSSLNEIKTSNPSFAQGVNFEFKLDLTSIGERTIVTSVIVKTSTDEVLDDME
jgi:predicted small lipoprotein YifL